jgi:hypothetical protein
VFLISSGNILIDDFSSPTGIVPRILPYFTGESGKPVNSTSIIGLYCEYLKFSLTVNISTKTSG